MEPVYGNHVGIVVSDQNDPEGRGRIKIWVPHINKTVYKDWNETMMDKKFKSSEFGSDLLTDLIDTLPWAESAVPTFGGGTSGAVKTVGTQRQAMPNDSFKGIKEVDAANAEAAKIKALSNLSPLGIDRNANPTTANKVVEQKPVSSLDDIPDNILKYIYSIGAVETGYQQNQAYGSLLLNDISGPKGNSTVRELYRGNKEFANDPVVLKYGGIEAVKGNEQLAKKIGGDVNAFQFNAMNAGEWGVDLTAPTSTQVVQIANYLNQRYPEQYKAIANSSDIPDRGIEEFTGRFNAPKDNRGEFLDAQTLSKDDIIAKFTKADTQLDPNGADVNTDQIAGSGDSSPVRYQNRVAAAFKSQQTGYGSANGYYSNPAVGAKVWVFFYGGDVQRPVYFASVPEKIGFQVATQTS
jgi:hypothetical protein